MKKIIIFIVIVALIFGIVWLFKNLINTSDEFDWQYGGRVAYFNSVNDLRRGLLNGFNENLLEEIESEETRRGFEKGGFRVFLQEFINRNQLTVPRYKGGEMPLKDWGKDNSSISFHYYELFSRPWIKYSCLIDNHVFWVSTMYIDDELIEEANEKGAAWLISAIAPGTHTHKYPNLDNYTEHDFVKTMYETELQLDGFSVTALMREDNRENDNRPYIHFVHNNIFVIIRIYPEALESGILENLSFKTIPLK